MKTMHSRLRTAAPANFCTKCCLQWWLQQHHVRSMAVFCCFCCDCACRVADCWATRARDTNGQLQADPAKFPSGMQALAESILSHPQHKHHHTLQLSHAILA
jgi:hypothetical protein